MHTTPKTRREPNCELQAKVETELNVITPRLIFHPQKSTGTPLAPPNRSPTPWKKADAELRKFTCHPWPLQGERCVDDVLVLPLRVRNRCRGLGLYSESVQLRVR